MHCVCKPTKWPIKCSRTQGDSLSRRKLSSASFWSPAKQCRWWILYFTCTSQHYSMRQRIFSFAKYCDFIKIWLILSDNMHLNYQQDGFNCIRQSAIFAHFIIFSEVFMYVDALRFFFKCTIRAQLYSMCLAARG